MSTIIAIFTVAMIAAVINGLGIAFLQGRYEFPESPGDAGVCATIGAFAAAAMAIILALSGKAFIVYLPVALVFSIAVDAAIYCMCYKSRLPVLGNLNPAKAVRAFGRRQRQESTDE